MKKIVFFLLIFLFIPKFVYASNLKIDELIIKNGELSIPFDPLNNEYTIFLDKEEFHVEFQYSVDKNIAVFVKGNQDLENNSVVTISLTDEKDVVEYHFQILKEEAEIKPVFLEQNQNEKTNFIVTYKNYIIPTTCLFTLYLVFQILFREHKK